MGVDVRSVSGYGIDLTDEIIQKMISAGHFTQEDYDEDPDFELEKTPFNCEIAGSHYSGKIHRYIIVPGKTLDELNKNAKKFIKKLAEIGVEISISDIKKISDVLWY